jgi:sterol desaturase/sphingolipid hydroxylase (fatty acid hydroxylase superfamily)
MTLNWWPATLLTQVEYVATVFVVALAIERLRPASRHGSWRALAFNLLTALIFVYLTALLVPPASALLDPARERFGRLIPLHFPDGLAGSILQTLAFFLIFDFFFYWWHRSQHAVSWLWVQHKFHHQEQWLNVTTVHRYHFSEEVFRAFAIYFPMSILFDFKPVTVTWFWSMITLWGYWIHMNLKVELGPASRWISGPQFHRLHHTPEHGDRNFAAFFPLWDRVFGTYRHPERGEFPERLGVRNASAGNTLYEATLYPIVEWAKALGHLAAVPIRNRRKVDESR